MSAKKLKTSTSQIMQLRNIVNRLKQTQKNLFGAKLFLRHYNTRNNNVVNIDMQLVGNELEKTAEVLRTYARKLKQQESEMQRHTKSLNRGTHKRSSTRSHRRSAHK